MSKKYILAATAALAIAAPAHARDGSPYIGIEAGALIAKHSDVDRRGPPVTTDEWVDWLDVDHKLGYDLDLIAGYDFGMFRLEAELGYKRARHKSYEIDAQAPGPFPAGVGPGAEIDGDGRTSVTSAMVNALIDVGDDDGVSFYGGGGIGIARVSMTIDQLGDSKYHLKDNDIAWQLIAGVRTAISANLDAGLKYRYFSAGTLEGGLFDHSFDARSSVKHRTSRQRIASCMR